MAVIPVMAPLLTAVQTRLRQIAPDGALWGPTLNYTAVKAIQEGDLGYLPTNPALLDDLPCVLIKPDTATPAPMTLAGGEPYEHTYSLRCVYVSRWVLTDDVPQRKALETDALASGFLEDHNMNGELVSGLTVHTAYCTSIEYDSPEEALLARLGIDDLFATAFEVTVTGYSQ